MFRANADARSDPGTGYITKTFGACQMNRRISLTQVFTLCLTQFCGEQTTKGIKPPPSLSLSPVRTLLDGGHRAHAGRGRYAQGSTTSVRESTTAALCTLQDSLLASASYSLGREMSIQELARISSKSITVKLRPRIAGRHIKETVWIGFGEGQLQNAGELVFESVGEWQLFGCALLLGAEQMKGQLTIVSEADVLFMQQLFEAGIE